MTLRQLKRKYMCEGFKRGYKKALNEATAITSFNHPYLDDEDVNSIVWNAVFDKTLARFIEECRHKLPSIDVKPLIKDDIFKTYAGLIKTFTSTKLLEIFLGSYDANEVIRDVIMDKDGQLEAHDIELLEFDPELVEMAKETFNYLKDAILTERPRLF